MDDEVIQSTRFNYSLVTLNYYFEIIFRPKGATLSCVTWAWFMVTGRLPFIINAHAPVTGRGIGGGGGGGRKNTRRKRRRKRKRTKRSKPNKKKRTKKHRKKRKYTKSRR